jgi:hypothetical protein
MADRDAALLGNGGFRSSGGSACSGRRPRRGDAVAAIAISGHRDLVGPREPRAFAAGPVAPPAPSPDLFPGQPRVLVAQPADHAPPQVVAEIREATAARGVATGDLFRCRRGDGQGVLRKQVCVDPRPTSPTLRTSTLSMRAPVAGSGRDVGRWATRRTTWPT